MDRTKVFIPQGSIIGMMLEIPAHQIIVQSTALGGIAQHDTFSWQIEDKHFVQLDDTNSDSRQVDTTFKEWVATVPDEELQLYFDLFFGTILNAGISSINDLSSFKTIEHIHHLLSKLNPSLQKKGKLWDALPNYWLIPVTRPGKIDSTLENQIYTKQKT